MTNFAYSAVLIAFERGVDKLGSERKFREFVPVGPQQVRLRLPQAIEAQSAKLLVADKELAIDHSDGTMTVTVPSILDHEVVVFTKS